VIVGRQLARGEVVIEITQLPQQRATAIVVRVMASYLRAAGLVRERAQDQQPDDAGQRAGEDHDGHPGSSSRSRATALATARRCVADNCGEPAPGGSARGARSQRRSNVNAVIKPTASTSSGR
jgi:hypothetical protein